MTTYSMTHGGLDRMVTGASLFTRLTATLTHGFEARRAARRQAQEDAQFLAAAETDPRVLTDLRAAIARASD
jgi:hypothetical protein